MTINGNGGPLYANRSEAGRDLAWRVARVVGQGAALVVGLPRGGVPVAFEIAQTLKLPMDIFLVRKLGLPGRPELAMGAIASGGAKVLNQDVLATFRITEAALADVIRMEAARLVRTEAMYRKDYPAQEVKGNTVIVVDDGLATGATMRVAVQALRQLMPARIVVAVPHGSIEAVTALYPIAEQIVCPNVPDPYISVGSWYEDFGSVSDAEVVRLLARARQTITEPTSAMAMDRAR